MEIRFVSGNEYKIKETQKILEQDGIKVIPFDFKIEELQTLDVKKLVKDKLLKAFRKIGKPLFVEHTGLYIEYLNDFPSGLTQIFWDKLQKEKFSEIIGNLSNSKTIAKTVIGYCDGKKIFFFEGEVEGEIVKTPKGDPRFQWDCVFKPNGERETFAEMEDRKNEISMRKKALIEFKNHLIKTL